MQPAEPPFRSRSPPCTGRIGLVTDAGSAEIERERADGGFPAGTECAGLDSDGVPVPGLYACGGNAHSLTASEYPGAGCQVGAGLTFGYLAARDAAGVGTATV